MQPTRPTMPGTPLSRLLAALAFANAGTLRDFQTLLDRVPAGQTTATPTQSAAEPDTPVLFCIVPAYPTR